MSSVISTNITSMIAQQNLNSSKSDLTTAMERLSSGMRINSAKDDAAGQAIANRMSSQITGLSQAQRNANDGISVAQTTEGALNQVNDNLQRIRELSVQASNGTNSDEDLESIQNEIGQRLNEINRISDETSFNGVKVLQQDSSLQIQVGANDGEAISINLKQINAETLGLTGFNVDGKGETPNTAATKESLTLAKATQVGDTNKYTLDTDNKAATTSDVLSLATKDSTVTVGNDAGTATYTAQEDGSFVKAQDYTNAQGADAIKDSMKPEVAGETKTATVTIGGETTKISIGSDGSIKGADSGKTLYLDTTGNLTETREGSIPAATIDNLSQSLATTDGAKIEMEDGATFENKGIVSGSELTDGTSTITAGAIDTALQGAAGGTAAGELAKVSITLNGETKTAYVDDSGNLWKNNDASAPADDTNAYSFDSNGNLVDYSSEAGAATAANLASNIKNNGGSVTLEAAGTSGATTNVGTTYSANYEVDETGTPATAADIEDAIKAGAGTAAMTVEAYDDEGNSLGSQDIEFTVDTTDKKVTAIKLDGEFSAGDGADGDLGDDGETVRLSADNGSLTGAAKTTVNYWLQDNGNVTNDSGQRIYEDGEGGFTTEEVTVGDRTQDPLGVLDSALKQVDSLRSDLGAIQNRFDSAITNLSTTETNLSAARSRIEDADYATEVSNMTRAQILQQAGTSVLAQANQVPQSVLSLLG